MHKLLTGALTLALLAGCHGNNGGGGGGAAKASATPPGTSGDAVKTDSLNGVNENGGAYVSGARDKR